MALDFGVSLVFCASGDSMVRMASQTFAGSVEFSINSIPPRQSGIGSEEANWCGASLQKGAHLLTCDHMDLVLNHMSFGAL